MEGKNEEESGIEREIMNLPPRRFIQSKNQKFILLYIMKSLYDNNI